MYTWEAANDDEITIISYDDKECAVRRPSWRVPAIL